MGDLASKPYELAYTEKLVDRYSGAHETRHPLANPEFSAPRTSPSAGQCTTRPDLAGGIARRLGLDRHQRRLRRRRLRRLHRGADRTGGWRACAQSHQQLHSPGPFGARYGGDHGRRHGIAPRRFAPGARSHGALPRQPVRVLHTRFCHQPLGALPKHPEGARRHPRQRPSRVVWQPVPLHRLSAHSGCRVPYERSAFARRLCCGRPSHRHRLASVGT